MSLIVMFLHHIFQGRKEETLMAKIDSVYNYYLTTYGSSNVSRYDAHKKSQLRDVYNRMVKLNKESPLYKISNSGDVQKFAIDIKENTRNIQNIVASLSSDSEDGLANAFEKKVATTSDESVATAQYIGDNSSSDDIDDFEIQVSQLALPQINTGNFLSEKARDFAPGSYSFDLVTSKSAYEFQFNVGRTDTNLDVQKKLAKLISNSAIGLSAEVISNDDGKSALQIRSNQTGLDENEDFLFHIMPQAENSSIQAMHLLGIDRVSTVAQNSVFSLNGNERTSFSNTFTVNDAIEVTLHGVSLDGESTTVGFKPNTEAIADNIETLADAYNSMLSLGKESTSTHENHLLLYEMGSVALSQKRILDSIGLEVEHDGFIHVNRDVLTNVVSSEDTTDYLSTLNTFKDTLNERAMNASLDPLKYVDRTLVAYKNPGKNFATPYITSVYSGMMLDKYC